MNNSTVERVAKERYEIVTGLEWRFVTDEHIRAAWLELAARELETRVAASRPARPVD